VAEWFWTVSGKEQVHYLAKLGRSRSLFKYEWRKSAAEPGVYERAREALVYRLVYQSLPELVEVMLEARQGDRRALARVDRVRRPGTNVRTQVQAKMANKLFRKTGIREPQWRTVDLYPQLERST
jgi:hypothetical protein